MKAGGYRIFYLDSSFNTVLRSLKEFQYDSKFHLQRDSKNWDCNGYRVGYLRPSKRNRIDNNIRERTIAQEKVRTCISELFAKKQISDIPKYSRDANFPGAIKDVSQLDEQGPNFK